MGTRASSPCQTSTRIDTRGDRLGNVLARIVKQDFVLADVDADRRKPGQTTVERRNQWVGEVVVAEVEVGELG
jgi:hypothetical protein